jgi:hypothetical protein
MLASRYERLRGDLGGRESVGQRLFCQRGLVAWLVEWSGSSSPPRPRPRTPRGDTVENIPASNADDLTMMIATLVHQVAAGAPP